MSSIVNFITLRRIMVCHGCYCYSAACPKGPPIMHQLCLKCLVLLFEYKVDGTPTPYDSGKSVLYAISLEIQ